jgi:hypothetical protein
MAKHFQHPTDEQLLLYADKETGWPQTMRVRSHLAHCAACSSRLTRIQHTLTEVAYHPAGESIAPFSGPRALFKARLAEAARKSSPQPSGQLRFARGLAYLCALALLTAIGVGVSRQYARSHSSSNLGMLPDPGFTPGSTRQVSLTDICAVDRDEVISNVPVPIQQRVFQEYGIKDRPATDFEVDYLITPGLGGSDDVRNLWPEPHSSTTWNSYVKDQLEDHLHRMVCGGQLSLGEAQKDIASNWILAYKKYFHTDQPLTAAQLAESSDLEFASYTGLNLRTARMPSTTNSASTVNWTMANGGSFPIGANAWSAGTLRNDWTIATNTLKYSAITAVTT